VDSVSAAGNDAEVKIGVNVLGVDQISPSAQDALLEQLAQNGVKILRTGLGGHGDHYTDFVIKAHQHGIGCVVIVSPFEGNTGKHVAPANKEAQRDWVTPALSDIEPTGFRKWFAPELARLDAAGVQVVAFEVGNEINTPRFNADFVVPLTSRVIGLAELRDPADREGQAVAAGLSQYVKVLATLKDMRDRSRVNRAARILTGVSASLGAPQRLTPGTPGGISMNQAIQFLRLRGADDSVDGYGVHLYTSSDPRRTLAQREAVLGEGLAECRPSGKPCWVTEWAYNNANRSCPIDDSLRSTLVTDERAAYKTFVPAHRLAALIYYSWSGDYLNQKESPGTIFRCGALTEAGKLALSPL
jgi:hypothetical protein